MKTLLRSINFDANFLIEKARAINIEDEATILATVGESLFTNFVSLACAFHFLIELEIPIYQF